MNSEMQNTTKSRSLYFNFDFENNRPFESSANFEWEIKRTDSSSQNAHLKEALSFDSFTEQ